MTARTTTAAALRVRGGQGLPASSFKGRVIVAFKGGKGRIEHFPAGHDHNVEPHGNLSTPKHFTAQAFRAVTMDRRPDLPCGGDAEPRRGATIGQYKHGHEPAVYPGPFLVDALKIQAAANTLDGGQHLAAHAGRWWRR